MIEKIKKYTCGDVLEKINELVDTVNGILDYAPLEMAMKAEPAENVPAPITLTDVFNEMGRLYADLWNKMEDIHYELKTKGGDNE